jgi:sorbitol-specific phosphotransferase system component IIA
MKNIFSFIVPYITALEKVFNLFSKIHKILEDDLLLQIVNPINPQDTKDICLFIKESFTKRETFKGNSLSSS